MTADGRDTGKPTGKYGNPSPSLCPENGDPTSAQNGDGVVRSPSSTTSIFEEVRKLVDYVKRAREEIANLNPVDIRKDFLSTAADELDAIVQSTETATGAIMDCAEIIENVAEAVAPEHQQRLLDTATQIYEACSFQDVTGQRVNKVVGLIKSIEHRLEALIDAFGPARSAAPVAKRAGPVLRKTTQAHGDKACDADLLNGPQDEQDAISQDSVDDLLNNPGDKR